MSPQTPPLDRRTRLAMLGLATAIAAVLGTALGLSPDPRGFGTHVQLGLPPCAFRERTGVNCPSCGMTTAVAWLVRGRPGRAWSANPGGVAVGLACLLVGPWLILAAARGRPWPFRSVLFPLVASFVAVVAWSVLAWTIRLLFVWRVMG